MSFVKRTMFSKLFQPYRIGMIKLTPKKFRYSKPFKRFLMQKIRRGNQGSANMIYARYINIKILIAFDIKNPVRQRPHHNSAFLKRFK